jgi:hypothetical protein
MSKSLVLIWDLLFLSINFYNFFRLWKFIENVEMLFRFKTMLIILFFKFNVVFYPILTKFYLLLHQRGRRMTQKHLVMFRFKIRG